MPRTARGVAFGGGQVQKRGEVAPGAPHGLPGVENGHVGRVEHRPNPGDISPRDIRLLVERRVDPQEALETVLAGLGVSQRLARGEDVDEDRVEVVDLDPDGVLKERFLHAHDGLGGRRACASFAGVVDGVRDVDVILRGSAGTVLAVSAVGDELGVGVKNGIGAQTGAQDVGPRRRDLRSDRLELQVRAQQPIDGLIEREAVRRAHLFGRGGDFEGTEEGHVGDRHAPRGGDSLRWLKSRGPGHRERAGNTRIRRPGASAKEGRVGPRRDSERVGPCAGDWSQGGAIRARIVAARIWKRRRLGVSPSHDQGGEYD